jgi:putative oxidoreductase
MPSFSQALLTVVGRLMLVAIFFLSAVGEKIPNFAKTADVMTAQGVPAAPFMLVGAIVFLIVGSAFVAVGYRARLGAALLLVFLILATYYFHPFWKLAGAERQAQMIQFMKNLALMGAMLFIMGNGSGPASLKH